MTDSEKIDFLGGQADVMLAFLSAVIQTHQNSSDLERCFNSVQNNQTATALTKAVSEPFLEGQAQTRKRIDVLFAADALRRS